MYPIGPNARHTISDKSYGIGPPKEWSVLQRVTGTILVKLLNNNNLAVV